MRRFGASLVLSALVSGAAAQSAKSSDGVLPQYAAREQVHGTLRVWGHGGAAGTDYIESLVRRWEEGFEKLQPDVHFDNELHGTASAMGALWTDRGDMAVMGRQIWPNEVEALYGCEASCADGRGCRDRVRGHSEQGFCADIRR